MFDFAKKAFATAAKTLF